MRKIAPVLAALLATSSAIAAETMTYSYDAHGRLTKVQRAGGNNNAVTTQYSYDPSDNRTNAWQNSGSPPTPPAPLPPAFSISDASVDEAGELVFVVTRHRSFAPPASYTVYFTVTGGTATSGVDFTPPGTSSVNFTSDNYAQEIRILTTHDTMAEANETLSVNLTSVTNGGTLIDATGAGTIVDNDSSNQPPVAANDYATTALCGEGVIVNVGANDTDPDGNYPLNVTAIISSTNGNALFEGPYIQFTPTAPGTGTVVYRITDSLGAHANGNLYVTITGSGPCN